MQRTQRPDFWLQVFGTPVLRRFDEAGNSRRLLGPGKPLAILVRLMTASGPLDRESLASVFWPAAPERAAKNSLRQVLYQLRSVLGPESLGSEEPTLRLYVDLPSDLSRLREAVVAGHDAEVLKLYSGPFLGSFELPESVAFEHWLLPERRRYERQFIDASCREVDRYLALHAIQEARRLLERSLELVPANTILWRRLLESLAHLADQSDLDGAIIRLRQAHERGILTGIEDDRLIAPYLPLDQSGLHHRLPEQGDLQASSIIGRGYELRALIDAWAIAKQGQSRWHLVHGPAGIGKSRLLEECATQIRRQNGMVLELRAHRRDRLDEHHIVARLIHLLFQLPGALGVSESVIRALNAIAPDLDSGSMLSRPLPTGGEAHISSTEAIADLLCAVADEQALCLVLEDLHWFDASSLALLSNAFRRLPPIRLLVLAASRHEDVMPDLVWQSMSLQPFVGHSLTRYIELLLEDQVDAMAQQIIAHAGKGLPLQTRHVVHLMEQTGLLVHSPMGWSVTSDAQQLVSSPRDLTRALIERLPMSQRRLLAYLALDDGWIPGSELISAVGIQDVEGLNQLDALEHLGLVRRDESDGWQVGHDEVGRAATKTLERVVQTDLVLRRALALSTTASSIMDVRRVIRLFLEADAPKPALEFIGEWHARERIVHRGHALAQMLLGDRAFTPFGEKVALTVPVKNRQRRTLVVIIGTTMIMVTLIIMQFLSRPARLQLKNTPNIVGAGNMGVLPTLQVHDHLGRVSLGRDGQRVRVLAVQGADSVTGVDRTSIMFGTVTLDSMRVWGIQPMNAPLTMDVAYPSGPSLRIPLQPAQSDSMWLEYGVINGTVLDRRRPSITVRPGAALQGGLRIRYTEWYGGVLLILSQFTTWRLPIDDTTTVASLLNPVERGFYQGTFVDLSAPMKPGEYWLVWIMAFEPAAVWVTSATSWRCKQPVWGNGDDLSELPSSDIAKAWGTGRIVHRKVACDEPLPRQNITESRPAVAVKVVVR